MKFLRLVLRNVLRNKLRTLLTLGSIVLVLVLIVVLTSLLTSLEVEDTSGLAASRIFVQHVVGLGGDLLPLAYGAKIAQVPGVLSVTPQTWFGGTYIDQRAQNFFGQLSMDPQTWGRLFPDYEIAPEELAAWQSERDSFIAGRQLVERHRWKVGDRIQIQGSYIPISLDLVLRGVYRGPDESNVFFHNKYLENSWIGQAGLTGTYVLRVASPGDVPRVAEAIDRMFKDSDAPVRAMPEKQFRLQFVEMVGNVKLLVRSIVLTVLFTVVLIVANTMAMSARERVREMAVMRALGFRPRQVLALVLSEALVLALAGGFAGVLLSLPFTALVVDLMKRSPAAVFAYNFHVRPQAIALAFLTSVLIGVVSGLVPAWRSSRVPVLDGLRRVV